MPIVLRKVTYTYQPNTFSQVTALQDIDLCIEDGDFVGIMGHTGCGKTSLVQIIAGLLTPTSGQVLLDGRDIHAQNYDRNELRQKVGIVFQYPEYQLFETTVEKDVAFGLKHRKMSPGEKLERSQWALETMGFSFDAIRKQSPLALSGGEKRRVAIAGVLVTQPKFFILDEPIAGLDPVNREAFLQMISKLRKDQTTVIMISHNADAISEAANRLILLNQGRIAADGTVHQVFSDLNRLKSLGMNASESRRLAAQLSDRGLSFGQDIVTYAELLQAIQSHLERRNNP